MSTVLITGSNDGLGRDAARRSPTSSSRTCRVRAACSGWPREADATGSFDALIHNAGIGFREAGRNATEDGHARTLAVNTLAPYLLTALMHPARRLIYLTSGLHE